jgi:hypothetical protein
MKRFDVVLKGTTPLLHHRMTEEALFGLLGAKTKKKKAAEERTPRQIAEEHAYKTTDGHYYIPLSYVSGAFAHVASDYKQSNSQRKSYKAIAGGVFRPLAENATLFDPETGALLQSFEVDVRKATNHKAGAVAVCRPRFDRWACKFQIAVNTDLMPADTAHQILNDAGQRSGIGSFRVSKGGYFGQFNVEHFAAAKD